MWFRSWSILRLVVQFQWKQNVLYWSYFLCIDCEPLDNTRICQTDDDVWRLSGIVTATNMCQDVIRPREASNMCPGVSSCQKHLKLGKQWTPQHYANNPSSQPDTTESYCSLYLFITLKIEKLSFGPIPSVLPGPTRVLSNYPRTMRHNYVNWLVFGHFVTLCITRAR